MKFLWSIISSMLILTMVLSCTERIDLPLDESSVKLVVDGTVNNDTAVSTIYLSKTTSYYYDQDPPKVTGASVNITDGVTVYELNETTPGEYQTFADFHGTEGLTYTLNIKLAISVGGYTEYTATSTMPHATILDSVNLVFYPEWSEDGVWEVRCFMMDPQTADFYRFMISRNDKSITDTLDEWFVTDDRFFNGTYTYGAAVYYLDQTQEDERLISGDKVTVELNTMSKEYNNFLYEAQIELQGSDPLFSGPPANVKGNISNGAIGFFAAYTVSRAYNLVRNPKSAIRN